MSSLVLSIALQYNIIILTTCRAKLFHKLEQLGCLIHIFAFAVCPMFSSEMSVIQVERNTNVTVLNLVPIPNVELRTELCEEARSIV